MAFTSLLAGCASRGLPLYAWPASTSTNEMEIAGVPFHAQEALQCGPAALSELLEWSGVPATPDALSPYLYVPEKKGTLQLELLAQTRRLGRLAVVIPPDPDSLLQELRAGHPVLVLQNNGLDWIPFWHYAVVIGAGPETVILRSGDIEQHVMPADTFLRTWRRAQYWGFVALTPGQLPASATASTMLKAIADFSRNNPVDAVGAAYAAARIRWPKDEGLALGQANLFYANGQRIDAEAAWRNVLTFAPESVAARNNLAWLLVEDGRYPEAHRLIDGVSGADAFSEQVSDTRRFLACREAGGSVGACAKP